MWPTEARVLQARHLLESAARRGEISVILVNDACEFVEHSRTLMRLSRELIALSRELRAAQQQRRSQGRLAC